MSIATRRCLGVRNRSPRVAPTPSPNAFALRITSFALTSSIISSPSSSIRLRSPGSSADLAWAPVSVHGGTQPGGDPYSGSGMGLGDRPFSIWRMIKRTGFG